MFLELIEQAHSAGGWARSSADETPNWLSAEIKRILRVEECDEVARGLAEVRERGLFADVGNVLRALTEIDRAFLRIHPRTRRIPGSSPALPRWLIELRDKRMELGYYEEAGDFLLIPRGPLWSNPRDEIESHADNVSDRYAALSRVPKLVLNDGRRAPVRLYWFGASLPEGVSPRSSPGPDRIGFVPVAEAPGEIHIEPRQLGEKRFAGFSLRPPAEAAQRLFAAVQSAGQLDIALASELVFAESEIERLQDHFAGVSGVPRLTVSGSGNTLPAKGSPPWNESSVLNQAGTVLWSQRKLVPAGLHSDVAVRYGLPQPEPDQQVMEDNQGGEEVVIADIDGLGRCIVLICQDLVTDPLADDLVRLFQPDWVLVPILDAGVAAGTWTHRKALELSARSHTRFAVCSSTSLPPPPGVTGPIACGLAAGPMGKTDLDEGRFFRAVHATGTPGVGVIEWAAGPDWLKSTVGAAPRL